MEREREEFHNSHYVPSRTSLWCPVCGAKENHGCTPHNATETLRYGSHNNYANGQVPRQTVVIVPQRIPDIMPARKDAKKPGWTPKGWA
jgi:hypothetical protein